MTSVTSYDKALAELANEAGLHDAAGPPIGLTTRMYRHLARALVFALLDIGAQLSNLADAHQRTKVHP